MVQMPSSPGYIYLNFANSRVSLEADLGIKLDMVPSLQGGSE